MTAIAEIKPGSDAYWAAQEDKFKALRERDLAAKTAGNLLGRYLAEPYADGHAFYEIVKINKATVRVQVVTGIGDDWVLPYWGQAHSIPMAYAMNSVGFRDRMDEAFSKRKAGA